jgi:tRNA(adenine34) deaminase
LLHSFRHPFDYHYWMQQALVLAQQALPLDVPVGAIILNPQGTPIGQGYNTREKDNNPLGHAELTAIAQAAKTLGTWRLTNCTLIVTLEPCPMCASALAQAKLGHIIYGADNPELGGCGSWLSVHQRPTSPKITAGILAQPCQEQLAQFFKTLR